ncbi:MAG TPA: hypothetical protein VH062_22945 [Polyangiaceae bacterium]|jgi:hypothetical protein|nr:hypothetical protein [Polyangiaceae bacterium]
MLVKRDNPISGLFDDSDTENTDSLWPDEDEHVPLPPPVEPSGYRPAPKGVFDSAEESSNDAGNSDEADGNDEAAAGSGVPTPRAISWSNAHLSGSTPLPVVTAAIKEPTQRGLGIPPPPSSREAAWLHQMPPLTSVPPLSLDAFDERAASARAAAKRPAEKSPEPSENERITVRAPAMRGMTTRQRRRAFALTVAAAAALFLGLFARRVTLVPERVAAQTAYAGAAAPRGESLGTVGALAAPHATAPQAVPEELATPNLVAAPAPPSSGELQAQAAAEQATSAADDSRRNSDGSRETRRERRRRLRAEAAARAATSVAASTPSTAVAPGNEPSAASRPTLSLPPR